YLVHKPLNLTFAAFLTGFNRVFDVATDFYGATITRILRFAVIALVLYVGLLTMTYAMTKIVPTGFIPEQDKGYLVVNAQLPDGASLERSDDVLKEMVQITFEDKELKEAVGHILS